MEHRPKTDPAPWDAVEAGEKRFEMRRNDRDFKVGDTLILVRSDSDEPQIHATVTYVQPGHDYSCEHCAARVEENAALRAELRGWLNLPYAEALDAHDRSTRALLGEPALSDDRREA